MRQRAYQTARTCALVHKCFSQDCLLLTPHAYLLLTRTSGAASPWSRFTSSTPTPTRTVWSIVCAGGLCWVWDLPVSLGRGQCSTVHLSPHCRSGQGAKGPRTGPPEFTVRHSSHLSPFFFTALHLVIILYAILFATVVAARCWQMIPMGY